MTIYVIEDPHEDLMTVRTRSGMLKGWFWPVRAGGKVSAARFHPTPYAADPEYSRDLPDEVEAVAWICDISPANWAELFEAAHGFAPRSRRTR
jgi:hypothetical protein